MHGSIVKMKAAGKYDQIHAYTVACQFWQRMRFRMTWHPTVGGVYCGLMATSGLEPCVRRYFDVISGSSAYAACA